MSAFDIAWRDYNRMMLERDPAMEDRMRVGRIITATTPLDVTLDLKDVVTRVMAMSDAEITAFIEMYELGKVVGA